jgi:hypothetical protein
LYRGGFTAVAVAVSVAVLSVVLVPRSPLARLLSVPPLPQLGRISYGLYLWHWPVTLFVTHGRSGLSSVPLFVLRVCLALLAALTSWVLVEQPVLQGRFRLPRPGLALGGLAVTLTAALIVLPLPAVPASSATAQDLAGLEGLQPASGPGALPSGEKPLKLMLEGDSIGLTLSFGLVPKENPQHVEFRTYAKVNCGIVSGQYVELGVPIFPNPNCANWQDSWRRDADSFEPDVTAVLVGRWELHDRIRDGRRQHIGEPAFDAHLLAQLDEAIALLSADHRKVALLTVPCFQQHEQDDGTPEPQDDPARGQRWNQLLETAAARRPDVARVFDITGALCPGGVYRKTDAAGRVLRTEDGIHITEAGSEAVGRTLLPALAEWERAAG